ncbi:hypothetical protein [Streptomyces olivaceoviridis]|uniref:hypothetical protein n=1 Tax=Streptomyces olivaceoviridis TaxID=1921 RepID=UPI0037AA0A93
MLVDEYLDSREVSVEYVTHRRESTVVAVTRQDVAAPPYLAELAHAIYVTDPLLHPGACLSRSPIV